LLLMKSVTPKLACLISCQGYVLKYAS
jgi:hypothetical protein